ncbi:MAG: ABC transporter substrate-binding protein [Lachnospiraceae bacterium]
MRKKSRMIALALAAVMALTACSSNSDSPAASEADKTTAAGQEADSTSETEAGTPASINDNGEKVLRIGTYMPVTTLVPWKTTSDGDGYIIRQIYHTLLEMNKQSEFAPGLAKSWECSEDGKVWTFHLRDDIYWQTGNDLFGDEKVQVTAEDVKFSFEYYLDPAHESVRYTGLADTIDKIEVVDDFTIKFYTKDIDVLFEYKMYQNYIIPKKGIDENWDFAAFPVGSGAYKFVEHVVDTRVLLEKNEDFWLEPALDKIEFKIITDKSVSSIALQNQEIDITLALLPTDIPAVVSKDFLTIDNNGGSLRWIGFNCKDELFQDKELRRALTMAVDVDGAVKAVYANDAGIDLAIRGYSVVTPERPGYDGELCKAETPVYDPKAAQEKLESIGWKKGSDGIYEKDGQKLKFTLQVGNNDSNREKMAVIVSSQLKAIGVDCTAQTVEWGTHSSDVKDGNVQMYIMGGYSNLDGPLRLMHSNETVLSPNCGYADPELDSVLDEAWRTIDYDARCKLIAKASAMFASGTAHLADWYEYSQTGYNVRVKDFDYATVYQPLCSSQRNVTVE